MTRITLLISGALLLPLATIAAAQTTTSPSTKTPTATPLNPSPGGYARLTPGNQRVVDALYTAQRTSATGMGATGYTRDQIAAMKQSGLGWGQVFQRLKAQGLVKEKNLGQPIDPGRNDRLNRGWARHPRSSTLRDQSTRPREGGGEWRTRDGTAVDEPRPRPTTHRPSCQVNAGRRRPESRSTGSSSLVSRPMTLPR